MAATSIPGLDAWIATIWLIDGSADADAIASETVATIEVRSPEGQVWGRIPRTTTPGEWVAAIETSINGGLATLTGLARGELVAVNQARAVVASTGWVGSGTFRAPAAARDASQSEAKAQKEVMTSLLDAAARLPVMTMSALELGEKAHAMVMRSLGGQLEYLTNEVKSLRAQLAAKDAKLDELVELVVKLEQQPHINPIQQIQAVLAAATANPEALRRVDAIMGHFGIRF